jgi:hypothetical protein
MAGMPETDAMGVPIPSVAPPFDQIPEQDGIILRPDAPVNYFDQFDKDEEAVRSSVGRQRLRAISNYYRGTPQGAGELALLSAIASAPDGRPDPATGQVWEQSLKRWAADKRDTVHSHLIGHDLIQSAEPGLADVAMPAGDGAQTAAVQGAAAAAAVPEPIPVVQTIESPAKRDEARSGENPWGWLSDVKGAANHAANGFRNYLSESLDALLDIRKDFEKFKEHPFDTAESVLESLPQLKEFDGALAGLKAAAAALASLKAAGASVAGVKAASVSLASLKTTIAGLTPVQRFQRAMRSGGPIRVGEVTPYETFDRRSLTRDGIDGHEIIQNALLKSLGLVERRLQGLVSRGNPTIALRREVHVMVTRLQRDMDIAKQTVSEHIDANIDILRRLGVASNAQREQARDAAMTFARELGLIK